MKVFTRTVVAAEVLSHSLIVGVADALATKIPLISSGVAASVQVYAKVGNGTVLFDNFMVDPYRRR